MSARSPAEPALLPRPRWLALVAAGAILLCWPMLLLGGPLLFHDTPAYAGGGELVVRALQHVLSGIGEAAEGGGTAGGLRAVAGQAEVLRSVPWSVFAYLVSLPFGPVGVAVVQNAIVLIFLVPLLGGIPVRLRDGLVAAGAMALLTPLPWYGSLVMPDILAAVVVLFGVLVSRHMDRLGWIDLSVLGLLAAFAILSHQGHLPLAAAVILAALLLRLVRGQRIGRGVALTAVAAPVIAAVAMLVGSAAVLDGPSVAPRRLPILLARSIEDGPARWHLQQHCATERYAVCEIFETIPTHVAGVLWGEQGLRRAAGVEQMQRIRDEEAVILWRAFKEYPLHQSFSLIRNAARQLVLVSGDDLFAGELVREPDGRLGVRLDSDRGRSVIEAFAFVWGLSAFAAALWIAAWAVRGRLSRPEQDMALMVAVGLVANAAIFGGLSAPADRYQARILWLVPALAALFWLSRRSADHRG